MVVFVTVGGTGYGREAGSRGELRPGKVYKCVCVCVCVCVCMCVCVLLTLCVVDCSTMSCMLNSALVNKP